MDTLYQYNKENLEPKRALDKRTHQNGVLSFYYAKLENPQEIDLDIANFYAKLQGRFNEIVEKKDYESKEKEIKDKIKFLLQSCSKRDLTEKFKTNIDLIQLFKFYNEKCEENYQLGRYNYIRSLLYDYLPIRQIDLENDSSISEELFKEIEKLSSYDRFCNTIYARTSMDMLNTKIIYYKSYLKDRDKIMHFFENEINHLKKMMEIKFERFNLYNRKGYIEMDNKTNELMGRKKDESLIGLIEIIREEYKNSEYIVDILNLVINNFSQTKITYNEFIKVSNDIDYLNIGYERTSLEVNKICLLIENNNFLKKPTSSSLSYNDMRGLKKTEDNNDLYIDIELNNDRQYIVFKIKKILLDGLDNEIINKIKKNLAEKIKEVSNRIDVNEQTFREDEIFIKDYLRVISLSHKLQNKNREEKTRNKI